MRRQRGIIRIGIAAVTAGLLVFLGGSAFARPFREGIGRPVVSAFAAAGRLAGRFRSALGGPSRGRIRALEDERVRLLGEIAARDSARVEDETLRAALDLRRAGEVGVLPALAAAFFREGRDEFLLLDHGTADGIGVGDIVLDRNRVLAGTVIDVAPKTARVILLSSPSRSTDILIPSANLRAIARGNNSRELLIDLVPQDSTVQAGDLVIASPRSAGGRRNLLVGEIRDVRQAAHEVFKTVRAIHLFDPADTDVLVLLAQ